ncbi:caspase family protein [Winogradskya consettensis]|uniref:Peptidase C14 caspase domain-containing protein n=1 Tax=Winogradskya consettensis TaxID=113560 RepID=A0A919SPS5_9ACTN|nr:caspase family protein [Actinoplanes consettensis]GIM75379.1 hypothetical protein Aco04nite_45090 [Actinoplanes consettensis]
MRKALIVGIDHYTHLPRLTGCVNDARAVSAALGRHADGSVNFADPRVLTSSSPSGRVLRAGLRDAVRRLFSGDAEIALFYFAGHGSVDDAGGFLCGSDSRDGNDGLALAEVMTFANRSAATNRVIILDSCRSGIAADHPLTRGLAEVTSGMTVLTASTEDQFAEETPGGGAGVFTSLLVDALHGAAANLVGDITPGSVYAHIDQSLGPWMQRPVFKTNVRRFVSLRTVPPPLASDELRALTTHFPEPGHDFALDPSYEPERSAEQAADPAIPPPDPTHTATFRVLQNYVKVNLLLPVGAPHMWHAAMLSKSCRLTPLGRHYWRLVDKGLL